MKGYTRTALTVLLVPAAAVLLLGCPRKSKKTEATPEPKVSESAMSTRSGAGAGAGAGTARDAGAAQTEEQRMAQLLASRGEDIPLKDAPATEFVEPPAEVRAELQTIYFDYDKSNIKPEYQKPLETAAGWLSRNPSRQLLIEGHCDERGTDEYNLALGERRALSVRRYLIALGVDADRLHTISYGEEKPAAMGHDESAWAKNRRAEFKISAQ